MFKRMVVVGGGGGGGVVRVKGFLMLKKLHFSCTMAFLKEAYPGMCGLIGWIKENDAFCKKNEVWDLELLQSRLSFHLPVL